MLLTLIVSAVLPAQPPAGPAPPSRDHGGYKFVLMPERHIGFMRGDALCIGKLDGNGDFSQIYTHEPLNGGGLLYHGPDFHQLFDRKKIAAEKLVYEFRSGVLIPGRITPNGNFIPAHDGKMILFADYRYSPSAPPIWNLPGRFEPIDPPRKQTSLPPEGSPGKN